MTGPLDGDCFAMLAMTGPLENGKMNGYRIKSGMTKGEKKAPESLCGNSLICYG